MLVVVGPTKGAIDWVNSLPGHAWPPPSIRYSCTCPLLAQSNSRATTSAATGRSPGGVDAHPLLPSHAVAMATIDGPSVVTAPVPIVPPFAVGRLATDAP